MIRSTQALLVMCLSVAAFAGEDFDRTMTAFTAMTLNQIKSLADLQKFDLGTANTKILKEELVRNGRAPFAPKKIEQTGATTIKLQFARSAVVLDLKEISSGVVYVNDRKVKMDSNKTYFNYKAEVDTILAMKKKDAFLRLLISEAIAAEEEPGSYVSWGLAGIQRRLAQLVGVETLTPENLLNSAIFNAQLADVLIAARKNSITQQSDSSIKILTNFVCEGARLKSVELFPADEIGKGRAPIVSITEMLDGSWSLLDFVAAPRSGQKDARILARTNGDIVGNESQNIFRREPFFEYPIVAKRCCVQTGCYAKVSAEFRKTESPAKRPRQSKGAQ